MNKEMVISSAPHETRVSILEEDHVVEVFIAREQSRGVVGNIYKGRVSKVLPSMQSAFVDLGLERDAFLYVSDVISPTEEALEDDEDEPVTGAAPMGAAAESVEPAAANGEAAADAPVAEAPPSTPAAPASAEAQAPNRPDRRNRERERQQPTARIEDLLKEG